MEFLSSSVFLIVSLFFIEENKKHYRVYTDTLVWCQFSEFEIKLFQSSSRRSYCKKQRSYRLAHKRIINYNAKHQNKVYSHFVHEIFFCFAYLCDFQPDTIDHANIHANFYMRRKQKSITNLILFEGFIHIQFSGTLNKKKGHQSRS